MNPTSIRFGPAGNSDSFYAAGYKRTADAPAYLQAMGLDALEYSFGRGVRMSQETAQAIREAAQAAGIALSVHLPYFINLAVREPEKQEKNLQYFRDGLLAARAMGASRAVFHPGSARGDRGEALARACGLLADILAALDQEGLLDTVTLCAETMGKINQLGSLEEVLSLCRVDPRIWPAVDFGHLHCRGWGPSKAGGIMRPSWMPWKLAWAWNGPAPCTSIFPAWSIPPAGKRCTIPWRIPSTGRNFTP